MKPFTTEEIASYDLICGTTLGVCEHGVFIPTSHCVPCGAQATKELGEACARTIADCERRIAAGEK